MPLGSSKFQNKNVQLGNGPGIPIPELLFTITESYSGNTATRLINTSSDTLDATTVTYTITSDVTNTTVGYSFTGNVASGDFTDATLSGNIVTDANGNATITKTVTSSGGHKDFVMNLVRPDFPNIILASSNVTNCYELTPITMSGGDTTTTSNITNPQYNGDGNVFFSTRIHTFTTTGNATLTITDYGNYEGNANIWLSQYLTTESVGLDGNGSYWQEGIDIRSLVIGGGGNGGAGAGAGEFGILRYPFANVSTGTYTMTVGAVEGNSHVFRGNATLERFAGGGQSVGDSYTDHWGSGHGGNANVSGSFIKIQAGPTDLADNVANASYPTNLSQYVEFASAFRGGVGYFMTRDGGGGAGGVGGAFNNPEISHYGLTSFGKGNNNGDGGHGISLPNTRDYPTTSTSPQSQTILSNSLQNSWYRNPIADGSESVTDVAGGRAGSSGGNGIGVNGYGGGNNQSGVVTISYPYRPAYRFVTAQDLS
jgi:hypothetical protein